MMTAEEKFEASTTREVRASCAPRRQPSLAWGHIGQTEFRLHLGLSSCRDDRLLLCPYCSSIHFDGLHSKATDLRLPVLVSSTFRPGPLRACSCCTH